MPLQRRVPKFGFTNPNRIEYRGINLDTIQMLVDEKSVKEINLDTLMDNGLAGKHDLVKILGRGKITSAIDVRVNKVSESAKKAIEKAGGIIHIITIRSENEEASVPSKSSEKVTKQ
jgi:large subunit ribosomal protein L15